jgi:hypothetical protein
LVLSGSVLKEFGGEQVLGPYWGLLVLLGGAVGFLGIWFLWDRWVPIRCPGCGSSMTKAHARRGRHFIYTCDSCGRTQ